ncbi:DNA polymerase III subunit alpha [Gudongella oleilytica]|jgi:DNA polymerase-3 subunit alpha|uniref:DNA polymerase III subunit alpha n=1 Tax=Gudongella oleilytica TaxID=1582259 RepID=UPI000FF89ED1|nr:DNA polymerase III subunit alpha [Gudongella oleilytica]MDY0256428.1 DNA polymerase III subunit alpha [Gudongella oleilytica]
MKKNFAHLHVHTEYSLLDGSIRIKDLISQTKALGMDSIAITDHGAMFGVVQFFQEAKKQGIKPILGSEVYVAINSRFDRDPKDKSQYHLVLLAKSNKGYENLMKVVSEGYVNGFYYRPRVDHEILEKYSEDIICLSACLGGEVQQQLLDNNYQKARETALLYDRIYGRGNFFLELQDHGIREQVVVNEELRKLSRETGIPLVATNDVHYLRKEDARVHDVLLCVQTGKTVVDEDRMKFPSEEFYLKAPDEMEDLFPEDIAALMNTVDIAERCNVELEFGKLHLPSYKVPEGSDKEVYFRNLCIEGLRNRYHDITPEIMERFEYELSVITQMGYIDYFLIVWDFIKYARDNGIMVGPGRGSAAGSIVSYALNIIDIDPLEYGLLFERFLNPERITMPDIDIDFCYERREEVIQYVIEKYGADRVAQIATFGTMAARGAIRDVGRAVNMPYGEVDYIAKQIPAELGITIDRALEISKTLKTEYDENPETRQLIDLARAVEGLPRHTSTHAAGVVISKEPITKYAPLLRNNDAITTQYTMLELEELGLLKMDFLGLRTLTVIRDSVDLIKREHGREIDFSRLSMDDPKVLQLFARAETLGIFQFESAGMRAFLKELKADAFEDLIAANSLFRPGPMNQIPTFVACKHDPSLITYLHPTLEPILDVTYGCIVYQEQVMEIVRKLGGYSFGRADLVRRAMGKKKMDVMEKERRNFIYGQTDENGEILLTGAIRNGVDETTASRIFDLMIDFANYAFNKSHSAAYAVIAYRTAWLKVYYPVEFMAALISSIMGNTSQVSLYIQECKRLNIEVLPPDINHSEGKFTVDKARIRYGLSAVKNVGDNLINAIIQARNDGRFNSFTEFIERIEKTDSSVMNKRAVESLIKAGAMDSLGANRAQLLSIFEKTIDGIHSDRKRNLEGQFSLFDNGKTSYDDKLPDLREFPQNTLLQMEKEILGIYISGHPLMPYEREIKLLSTFSTADLISEGMDGQMEPAGARDGQRVAIAGLVIERKNKVTRNNNMMAFVTLEDLYGAIECIVFPAIYEKSSNLIEEDSIVLVEGRLSISEVEDPKIIVEKISPIKKLNFEKIYLKLQRSTRPDILGDVKGILSKYPGETPVYVFFEKENKMVAADRSLWIKKGSSEAIEELQDLLGKDCVKLS